MYVPLFIESLEMDYYCIISLVCISYTVYTIMFILFLGLYY